MENRLCPQCGNSVTDELPGGLCPACLIEVARKSARNLAETAAMAFEFQPPGLDEMTRLFPELEIFELVGQGGMGAVYRVRQKNLDRVVALKVFLYKPDDPEFAARFQREARALARLNHPNIVTVHDFGTRENTHFLIMEYVDGLNLRQVTTEEKLSPEMALQMVPQLCDALQYAHDHGVIHRDIKPENLLLDTNGQIKIADFGLAKMTGSGHQGTLTHTRQVMGTLNYMAPEQRERPTEVDHRADIYSLGVVIYEMLTGELPIGRFLPPSEKSALDARLDEVVMRALEKEPDRRYQQASEFKSGFSSVGNGTLGFVPAGTPVAPVKSFGHASYDANPTRVMMSILAGREKKGAWRPGKPQLVVTVLGASCLDLTEVDAPEISLTILTLLGGSQVIVPEDAEVDLDGFILLGANDERISKSDSPTRQRIRIRSWGMLGSCNVRTASPKPSKPVKASAVDQYRQPLEHQPTFRNGLVFLYKLTASLVGLAAAIIFLLSGFYIIDDEIGRLAGIIAAISCGMIWAGLKYFRRLIGAGPEKTDAKSIREYYSSTIIGTIVRSVALMIGFACPMLFVVAVFENHDKAEIRLAAIICGIICVVLNSIVGNVEEFFFGKLKD